MAPRRNQKCRGRRPHRSRTILKPDGSLDLARGFSGSLDVKGFKMVMGPGGEPRFVPDAAAETKPNKGGAAVRSAEAASTVASSSHDDLWDSQFALSGANDCVFAMVADGAGSIYIGGTFSAVGGVVVNGIAKWNGTSWSPLGTGVHANKRWCVYALAVSGSDLYAGGCFDTAGDASANGIAKWDGTCWSSLGTGLAGSLGNAPVAYALAVMGNELYLGGQFASAGGVSANCVAKWDGTSWSGLGKF